MSLRAVEIEYWSFDSTVSGLEAKVIVGWADEFITFTEFECPSIDRGKWCQLLTKNRLLVSAGAQNILELTFTLRIFIACFTTMIGILGDGWLSVGDPDQLELVEITVKS